MCSRMLAYDGGVGGVVGGLVEEKPTLSSLTMAILQVILLVPRASTHFIQQFESGKFSAHTE